MNFCWKIILALLIFSSCSKDPKSNNAVVVTRHHLATDIGAEILKNGGNAIDSAVAVAFALALGFSFGFSSNFLSFSLCSFFGPIY